VKSHIQWLGIKQKRRKGLWQLQEVHILSNLWYRHSVTVNYQMCVNHWIWLFIVCITEFNHWLWLFTVCIAEFNHWIWLFTACINEFNHWIWLFTVCITEFNHWIWLFTVCIAEFNHWIWLFTVCITEFNHWIWLHRIRWKVIFSGWTQLYIRWKVIFSGWTQLYIRWKVILNMTFHRMYNWVQPRFLIRLAQSLVFLVMFCEPLVVGFFYLFLFFGHYIVCPTSVNWLLITPLLSSNFSLDCHVLIVLFFLHIHIRWTVIFSGWTQLYIRWKVIFSGWTQLYIRWKVIFSGWTQLYTTEYDFSPCV
jgi:hypothetical protein